MPEQTLNDVIRIAILAVGGQGGGVLSSWIADLATLGGYDVQATSVAGVAQRTGATIYYIEMAPKSARVPVFAQSPAPGDVDIVIAAELAEAGRAVMRGFVTPDRTTLITSSHRILAVSEKQTPGDGRADPVPILTEIQNAALKTLCFDMEKIAADAGSVISSSLFGALAKSTALPFDSVLFEEVITASGRGVAQSLSAFRTALAFEDTPKAESSDLAVVQGSEKLLKDWNAILLKLQNITPIARTITEAGLRKVVDYQDIDYGHEYLDHVLHWQQQDCPEQDYALTIAAAKYIANALCYDDILRVAELKTRASRYQRILEEQGVDKASVVHVTEYFHPRAEEICSIMPMRLGGWCTRSPRAFGLLERVFHKGRRIRTDRLGGFFVLRALSLLQPYRRKLLRHRQESAHLARLQQQAEAALQQDYRLAVEIFRCQRLIKGYSDTHARGHSKFDRILEALPMLAGRGDAAEWLERLREAALQDESGHSLDGAIKTIASFVNE